MDVCGIFLGDSSLSYGTMRNSIYRDYEKFPYGTLENIPNQTIKDHYSKIQEKCQQSKKDKKDGDECPFCKEHKKRPLISYLRKRELQKNNEKICEEEEELGEQCISSSGSKSQDNQQHSDRKHCERRNNCTNEDEEDDFNISE